MNMCTCCTSLICSSLPVSTRSRNSSRHPPPQNLHIHRNVPKREKNVRDSRYGFTLGSLRTRHSILAPIVASGSRMPLHRLDLTSVVDHPTRLLRTLQQQRHELPLAYMYKCTELNATPASSQTQPRRARRPNAHTETTWTTRWSLRRKHTGFPRTEAASPVYGKP